MTKFVGPAGGAIPQMKLLNCSTYKVDPHNVEIYMGIFGTNKNCTIIKC